MPTAHPPPASARLGESAEGSTEAGEELQRLAAEPATACLNCGARLPGAYCPNCGQRAQPVRSPLHRFLVQNVAELFGLDHRVWRSLGALVFKPGTLTRAYLTGRRETYLRPLRIYLSATVLFFLLLSTIDPVGRARDTIFIDRDGNDSLTVAAMTAEIDSTLAVGFDGLSDGRARRDSVVVQGDSLAAAGSTDVEDAAAQADEILQDSLSLASDLRRARITRAVLAELPPDSVVVRDLILGPANLAIRDSASIFDADTDEWLLKSEAVQSISGAPTDAERSAALARFLRAAIGYVPSVLFVILPVFAMILKVLYVRRDWHFSEHLVFGLHTHAFAFVAFIAMTLALWAASEVDSDGTARSVLRWTVVALTAAVPVYFFAAQKRVYAQGWIKTALKAGALALVYNAVLFFGIIAALMVAAYFG